MPYFKLSMKNVGVFLMILFVFGACEKDNENIDPEILEINRFVSDNMKGYYLWNTEMPNLNPNKQPDTRVFFDALLYDKIDRWSFITDDVDGLNDYFAGVRKELGYSLRGYYLKEGSDRVIVFVEYVEPNGPADRAGVRRGDLIVRINGDWITPDNYGDLFYADQLTIGLGTLSSGDVLDLSPSVAIVAEVLQVNPILCNVVFNVGGKKIGYLAYTGFIDKFDSQLETVFAEFKAEGVSDLILDLRYNGGGSVSTAKLMASMICPASCVGKLFLRTAFNDGIEAGIKEEYPTSYTDWFEDYFEANANNLDLSNLYVLTTEGTASASEMVIYSLAPYMNVVQIGEQTHGKYYGSITIDDENRKHTWAIQPIVMRAENVDNSIDYSVGLLPDFKMNDVVSYQLGTTEDVLTAFAISKITGLPMSQELLKSASVFDFKPAHDLSKKENPLKYEMYIGKK